MAKHKKTGRQADLPGSLDKRKILSVGHDKMAHPSHHQANSDHGTPMGFLPREEYQDGGCDHHLGNNVADED